MKCRVSIVTLCSIFFCWNFVVKQVFSHGENGFEDETKTLKVDELPVPGQDMFLVGSALVERLDVDSKRRGYGILKQASSEGNHYAHEILAYGYIFGAGLERNFTEAFNLFSKLAAQGYPAGQQGLGLMYSLGIGVESNQAKAVLNYVFAALGGNHFAQMAMGYRSLMGINVLQSCESALLYYYKAAEKVIRDVSPITGGHAVSKVRLMDEDEPPNIYAVSEDDMMHYHHVFADSGNSGAQVMIGMFYMYGSGGVERNIKMALKFLEQAAKDGVATANTLIGKIYAEGSDDVPRDFVVALNNFQQAIDLKHGDGYSGMGMLYLNGMGVEQSYSKAFELFQQAADRGSAEGQYHLGYMHYHGYGVRRDYLKALRYFQLAAHGGHISAIYKFGEMHAEGIGVKRNCNYAVDLFKTVSERGHWTRMFMEAERLYETGDIDSAVITYLFAAELGVEIAQSNVAYILEQGDVAVIDKNGALKRALMYWSRAASQGYVDARVKLGDYYYYGRGTSINYEVAAHQYRIASDKQTCAQAMFNLGYMYQEGLGLEQDYHLAKRYYDMASETSAEAIFPVNVALLRFNVVHLMDTFNHVLDVSSVFTSLQSYFGPHWDIYVISLLVGVIVFILFRRRNNL